MSRHDPGALADRLLANAYRQDGGGIAPAPRPERHSSPTGGLATEEYPGDPEPTPQEVRQSRRLEREARERHQPGDAAEPAPQAAGEGAEVPKGNGWRWRPTGSREFANADYQNRWLVKRVLVAGQPALIGAPVKCLKTTLAVDLAVSLASATPFLGKFDAYGAHRVAILSGESGSFTLQETARRVCRARGVDLAALPIYWQFDLPRLGHPGDLHELARGLAEDGIDVVVIDPLYLTLLSGVQGVEASNMFQMGPLLLKVARACLDAGATPVLVHHVNRPAARKLNEPLGLEDLAFSGCAEFARQWLLINRREPYTPGEPHRLRLLVGGSCGQSGLWALDIDEGNLDDEFGGRRWEVKVVPAGEAMQERQQAAAQRRQDKALGKERDDERKFLQALDDLDKDGRGASLRSVRIDAGLNADRVETAAHRLIKAGIIEDVPGFQTQGGNGAKRAAKGVRRVPDVFTQRNDGTTEQERRNS